MLVNNKQEIKINKMKIGFKYLPITLFAIVLLIIMIISARFSHLNNSYLWSIIPLFGISLVLLSLMKFNFPIKFLNIIIKIFYSLFAAAIIVLYELFHLPEMPWDSLNSIVLWVTTIYFVFVMTYIFIKSIIYVKNNSNKSK